MYVKSACVVYCMHGERKVCKCTSGVGAVAHKFVLIPITQAAVPFPYMHVPISASPPLMNPCAYGTVELQNVDTIPVAADETR